jgi:hypothetical protein
MLTDQVPPEIMELLSDDSATDMSAKEIMRRWEQRGKDPNAPVAAASPNNQGGTAKRKDERNAPQITQADHNLQGFIGESARPMAGGGGPQHLGAHDMGAPNPPFGQGSQGSGGNSRNGSPHRHSYRSPAYPKQIGTAGAG